MRYARWRNVTADRLQIDRFAAGSAPTVP